MEDKSPTNYYDLLKTSSTSRYFSYMNKKYIELVGPKVKVFKLDKKATIKDDLYGTELHSRIYLPPFEINALYLTNPWEGLLDMTPYQEKENNIKFVVNFDAMVNIVRELKVKNSSELKVEYTVADRKVPSMEKINNVIKFYFDGVVAKEINLANVFTFKQLATELKTIPGVNATYDVNDETSKIKDFYRASFKNETLVIAVKDITYDNLTDVIEMGDVIVTEKWRVYEVRSANPTSDFGWDYSTYTIEGNLIELDLLDGLPGDYRAEIQKHHYGMRKIDAE